MSLFRRRLVLPATLVTFFAWVALAGAHEKTLQSTTPANGADVPTETVTFQVTYSAAVTAVDAVMEAPDGSTTRLVPTSSGSTVQFPLRFTMPGPHVVRWRVPQSDSHLVDYRRTLVATAPQLDVGARRADEVARIWLRVVRALAA